MARGGSHKWATRQVRGLPVFVYYITSLGIVLGKKNSEIATTIKAGIKRMATKISTGFIDSIISFSVIK